MIHILQLIDKNYESHFKGIKVDDIENLDLTLVNTSASSMVSEMYFENSNGFAISTREIYICCDPYPYIRLLNFKPARLYNTSDPQISFSTTERYSELPETPLGEIPSPISTSVKSFNEHLCRPLCFDRFFIHSTNKLNSLHMNYFMKDKMFNEILFSLCKTQIR